MISKLVQFLPSLLFIAIAIPYIERPGVQYDEILYGNAALGNLDGTFVRKDIFGFPVLLMTYIGALKAYFYYPIFKLFGVSALTIRLPMIIVSALGIQFLYSIYKQLGVTFALVLSVLFALQPSLVMYARADVGPIVIETFLKLAVLSVLVSAYLESTNRKIILLAALCLLGVFNKLNFIWFVNATMGAFLIVVFFQIAHHFIRTRLLDITSVRSLVAGVLVYAPSLMYFLVINYVYQLSSAFKFTQFLDEFPVKVNQFYEVLTGASFSRYAIGLPVNEYGKLFVLYSVLVVGGGVVCFALGGERLKDFRIPYVFLVLTGLLVVVQVFYTGMATNPWHALSLEPIYSIVVGLSVWAVYVFVDSRRGYRVYKILVYSIVCVFAFFNGSFIYRNYKSIRDDDGRANWSTSIHDLIEYVNTNEGVFYSADWGFHTQLITFIQDHDKVKDVLPFMKWSRFSEKRYQFERDIFEVSDSPVFFIFHLDSVATFPEIKSDLIALAARSNAELAMHKQFVDSRERIRYEIFLLSPMTMVSPD